MLHHACELCASLKNSNITCIKPIGKILSNTRKQLNMGGDEVIHSCRACNFAESNVNTKVSNLECSLQGDILHLSTPASRELGWLKDNRLSKNAVLINILNYVDAFVTMK